MTSNMVNKLILLQVSIPQHHIWVTVLLLPVSGLKEVAIETMIGTVPQQPRNDIDCGESFKNFMGQANQGRA